MKQAQLAIAEKKAAGGGTLLLYGEADHPEVKGLVSYADNIAFGLKQDSMPKAQIEARVAEMLKLVQMSQYAKRKPHQLSGGQRQRVALAAGEVFWQTLQQRL